MRKSGMIFCCLVLMPAVAAAGPAVVGKRLEFSPAAVAPGERITPTVHFSVEGGRVELFANYLVQLPPAPGGMPRPTVVGAVVSGTFEPGDRSLALPAYEVPRDFPRLCFTVIAWIGASGVRRPIIEGACLEEAVLSVSLEDRGRGYRVPVMTPNPGTAAGEAVDFSPESARPGGSLRPTAVFRIVDAPAIVTLKYRAVAVVRPGTALPETVGTVRLNRRAVGNYRMPMPAIRIPDTFFSVLHYTVYIVLPNRGIEQTLINDARIRALKGYRISNSGTGLRLE